MMIVIVSTVSIVSMLLAVFVLYFLVANGLASDYEYTSTGFKAFSDMMKEKDFSSEFGTNMALTAVFSIIGVVAQIAYLFRSVKRQQEIK